MTRRMLLTAFLVAVIAPQALHAATIADVAWLRGCWELVDGGRRVEEQWMAPAGGAMLGLGRTVRDGTLVEYEFVIVREQGDRLEYHAQPSGQAAASFLSRSVTADDVVFENPTHDFPQRVGYRRTGGDTLLAWIEGTVSGQNRRREFAYRRAECQPRDGGAARTAR